MQEESTQVDWRLTNGGSAVDSKGLPSSKQLQLRLTPPLHVTLPPPQADRTQMLEMFSREGECVPFEAPVEAKGNIEVWLLRLVEGMQVRQGGGRWTGVCVAAQPVKRHAW